MCQKENYVQEGFARGSRMCMVLRVSKRLGGAMRVGSSPDWVRSFLSISAIQWLCNANKKSDIPAKRLYCFFSSLYSVLVSMRSPPSLSSLLIPPAGSDGVGSVPRESHSNGSHGSQKGWQDLTVVTSVQVFSLKRNLRGLTSLMKCRRC